ncbi:hypothetical protein MMC26_006062 [Xylographa opegraphella]|nr:hypothetical protein [Xylographa opegraphella]
MALAKRWAKRPNEKYPLLISITRCLSPIPILRINFHSPSTIDPVTASPYSSHSTYFSVDLFPHISTPMQPQSTPMDYFHAEASRYWDAYVSPSRLPVREVTSTFSITTTTATTTTTAGGIFEDDNGNEYYVSTSRSPSPSHQAHEIPRYAARHVSWLPAADSHHYRRGPYGQYNQHFIEAERRDLEMTRQRYRDARAARENSVEKLCRKVNSVVDKVVKQPWKNIMGRIRRKSQPEVEGKRDTLLGFDS